MTDLADFLLARIAEEEAVAREANGRVAWLTFRNSDGSMRYTTVAHQHHGAEYWTADGHEAEPQTVAPFYDSRRILAKCAADRRIVERESQWRRTKDNVSGETRKPPDDMVTVTWMDDQYRPHEERVSKAEFYDRFTEPSPPSETLKLLALPYADHPDWREEWRA